MNAFKFHRELDIPFLQNRFGKDPFEAREVFGSFIELAEQELGLLEIANEQKRFPALARVAGRLHHGLEVVGLKEEKNRVESLRAKVALGNDVDDLESLATDLIDSIRNKANLLKIEVQRLDRYLENSIRD